MRRLLAVGLIALLAACSSNGGDEAATTTRPARDGNVRIASINILHGFNCPPETNACQADDRIALWSQLVEQSQCPDILALQEIDTDMLARVEALQPTLCGGDYDLVWHGQEGIDRELVLTTLPVRDDELFHLAGGQRSAYRVLLDSPVGPLRLTVTHLGANQENDGTGGTLCRIPQQCPPEPCPAGTLVITCQVGQLEDIAKPEGAEVGVIVGDFNLTVQAPQVVELLDRGWIDSYLESANPECDPATGVGCTSGRDDVTMVDLTEPTSKEIERIDLLLVRAPDDCVTAFDPIADTDHDGLGTGLWADIATPDGPGGVVFVSDHTGIAADLSCART